MAAVTISILMLHVSISVLLIIVLSELNLIPIFHRGFLCNDPAISYKFAGDTITTKELVVFCILLQFILVRFSIAFYYKEELQMNKKP